MKGEKKRFVLGTADKIWLGLLAVLSAVILVLSILQRCGLSLINGTVMLYLPVLAILTLVSWGIYALVRRIKNRTAKVLLGGVLVLVLMLALVVVFTYISFMSAITVPQRYATLKSPSGARQVVVMRLIDAGEERVNARKAARLAQDPDGDTESILQDWCYQYRAYPKALGPFYRSNADVQGEVYLAYDGPSSEEATAVELPRGTLMVEWLDDETTAHFYVQDPGPGEGGECTVKMGE